MDAYWRLEEDAEARRTMRELLASPSDAWVEIPLFQRIIWPASTGAGDRMGFDIFGLMPDLSSWLCIEVKATDGPPETPFEMTINEYRTARRELDRYAIARVSQMRTGHPVITYWRNPALLFDEKRLAMVPVRFQVAISG